MNAQSVSRAPTAPRPRGTAISDSQWSEVLKAKTFITFQRSEVPKAETFIIFEAAWVSFKVFQHSQYSGEFHFKAKPTKPKQQIENPASPIPWVYYAGFFVACIAGPWGLRCSGHYSSLERIASGEGGPNVSKFVQKTLVEQISVCCWPTIVVKIDPKRSFFTFGAPPSGQKYVEGSLRGGG